MRLSIVIPAYNESSKILRDLEGAGRYLRSRGLQSEVLVIDDGSRDGTAEAVERFIRVWPDGAIRFRLLRCESNGGKGSAVRYGMARARGEIVAFVDSGLCVPFRYLDDGMARLMEGWDFAIASRDLPGTRIVRAQPLYRRIGSRLFWLVLRWGLGIRTSDTQCGFKLYTARAAKEIFSRLTTDGFMFDVEAILVASKLGLKGAEFPVEWGNDADTRYHPLWGTLRNFRELARIRRRWLGGGT